MMRFILQSKVNAVSQDKQLFADVAQKHFLKICQKGNPVDTGRKLNVHNTFKRCPGRLLNVLCTFNLRSVSTGKFLWRRPRGGFITLSSIYGAAFLQKQYYLRKKASSQMFGRFLNVPLRRSITYRTFAQSCSEIQHYLHEYSYSRNIHKIPWKTLTTLTHSFLMHSFSTS